MPKSQSLYVALVKQSAVLATLLNNIPHPQYENILPKFREDYSSDFHSFHSTKTLGHVGGRFSNPAVESSIEKQKTAIGVQKKSRWFQVLMWKVLTENFFVLQN